MLNNLCVVGLNCIYSMESHTMLKYFFQDFLGKSDPYLEFSRQAADNSWMVVHRTEVKWDTLLYNIFSSIRISFSEFVLLECNCILYSNKKRPKIIY